MKIQFWVLTGAFVAVIGATVATAQTPATNQGPRIEFATPAHHLGKVNGDEPRVRYEFIFTNTGDQTLEITNINIGCSGCTAAKWDREVAPGRTGIIPVACNFRNMSGPVMRYVTVNCNDPAHPFTHLQLRATVWRPIDVTPRYAVFQPPPENATNETRVVNIINNTEEPMTLGRPACSNECFKFDLKEVKPGKEFALAVTYLPPPQPATSSIPITIQTSLKQKPHLELEAYVMPKQPFEVWPPFVILPPPQRTATNASVHIRNNSANALVLSEPAVSMPGVEIRIEEIQAGQRYTLKLEFPPGFTLETGQRLDVSLRTNHPRVPLIKVGVSQAAPITPLGG